MVNGLLDFGDDDGWSGYVGGGVGLASVKYNFENDTAIGDVNENDGGFAWQVIAGVRKAVSTNIELGLKYRFFNTTKFKYGDDVGGELNGQVALALAAAEPDLQLLAAASAAAASAAAAAASGDADVPGRFGDPGNGSMSASAAAAAAAAASAGAGTRLSQGRLKLLKVTPGGLRSSRGFFLRVAPVAAAA